MEVNVHVVNQRLKIATNVENLVEGSRDFVKFVFLLDSGWDGLTKTALFKQGDSLYSKQLDEDNSAFLPSEISAGRFSLSLRGSGSGVTATTKSIMLNMDAN